MAVKKHIVAIAGAVLLGSWLPPLGAQNTPCLPAGIKLPKALGAIFNNPNSPIRPPAPCPANPPAANNPAPAPPAKPVAPAAPAPVPAAPPVGGKWSASDPGVVVDATVTVTGITVYAAHRDGSGVRDSAVFSGSRMVASSGDALGDGKIIIRVLKDELAVLPTGQAVWSGEYADNLGEAIAGKLHRGLFIEQRFTQALPDTAPAGK